MNLHALPLVRPQPPHERVVHLDPGLACVRVTTRVTSGECRKGGVRGVVLPQHQRLDARRGGARLLLLGACFAVHRRARRSRSAAGDPRAAALASCRPTARSVASARRGAARAPRSAPRSRPRTARGTGAPAPRRRPGTSARSPSVFRATCERAAEHRLDVPRLHLLPATAPRAHPPPPPPHLPPRRTPRRSRSPSPRPRRPRSRTPWWWRRAGARSTKRGGVPVFVALSSSSDGSGRAALDIRARRPPRERVR